MKLFGNMMSAMTIMLTTSVSRDVHHVSGVSMTLTGSVKLNKGDILTMISNITPQTLHCLPINISFFILNYSKPFVIWVEGPSSPSLV